MHTYYPTVSVEVARMKARLDTPGRLRPVVLVVDDEPIITLTLATILRGSGLVALTAANAFEALEIAAIIPPQILITDVAMPGMNGLELAARVGAAVPDCEIIVFSGQASCIEMSEGLEAMGRRVTTLLKPVHPADLLEKVFDAMGREGSRLMQPQTRQKPSLYDLVAERRSGPDRLPWSVPASRRDRSSEAGEMA